MSGNIFTGQIFFILKDKACEGLDNGRHEESEEGGDDRVSDAEEKRLREEAVYEKIMVSLQNGIYISRKYFPSCVVVEL
jgi:hypothetical protein